MLSARAWRAIALTAIAILLAAALLLCFPVRPSATAQPTPAVPASAQPRAAVSALGHFEPDDGVVRVAAPYYESRPSVVARLAVKEGDWVRAGQLIAILDGKAQMETSRAHAQAEVELARRRVEQVRAGAKPGDLEAQQSEVDRLEAAHRLEQSQLQRLEKLYASRDVSLADVELHRSAVETSRHAVEQARHRLTALNQVRDPDLRVAESELLVAQAQLADVESRLASLTVNAPSNGRAIRVHSHVGEQTTGEGIVELADTRHMSVEAEVYASNVAAVRIGQRADIELEGGGSKLQGEVTRIGHEVRRGAVLPEDPVAYSDAHVVAVRIRVPGCTEETCPIHARVRVVIGTGK